MPDPFAIGALLGGALLLFAGKGKGLGGPPGAKLPDPDIKDLMAITEWKTTPQGMARYYKREFIASIAVNLQACGVIKVVDAIYKGSRVLVYRLNDRPVAGATAIDIAKIGYAANAAVMVTANFWLKSGGPAFLAVIPYDQRSEWTNLGHQWAIEFDAQAGEPTPGTTTTPPPKIQKKTPTGQGGSTTSAILFDSNMTPEEMASAAILLSDETLDPAFSDAQAAIAESPLEAHGGHPKLARLLREHAQELRDKKFGKTGPRQVPTAKKAPPPPTAKDPGPPKDIPPGDNYVPPKDAPPAAKEPTFVYALRTDTIDLPYNIVKRYTGNGNRWREFMPINPQLKEVKIGNTTQVQPWIPGSQSILLPTNWVDPSVPLPKTPVPTTPGEFGPPPPQGDDGGGSIFGKWGG